MSTPLALPAIGTLLSYGNGMSPETYTLISNDSSITGLGMSVNMVDVTNHSQGFPWVQMVPVLLNSGDMSFDMYFIPNDSGHKVMARILENAILQNVDEGEHHHAFSDLVAAWLGF